MLISCISNSSLIVCLLPLAIPSLFRTPPSRLTPTCERTAATASYDGPSAPYNRWCVVPCKLVTSGLTKPKSEIPILISPCTWAAVFFILRVCGRQSIDILDPRLVVTFAPIGGKAAGKLFLGIFLKSQSPFNPTLDAIALCHGLSCRKKVIRCS